MKINRNINIVFLRFFEAAIIVSVLIMTLALSGCAEPEYTLEYSGPTPGQGDSVFPETAIGRQIKEHLNVMGGVGVNAESNYQKSLVALRGNPEVLPVLAAVYEAIDESDYYRRTLVVETLKEMRSLASLKYLADIANSSIPKDRMPNNAEVNTREDEVVIRITAVQGLSILANQQSREASDVLLKLVSNENLTVRQMAARGYINSSIGSVDDKLKQLREMVPRSEHWYLTSELTKIREVQHPEVLPDFDLDEFMERRSDNAPKTERKQ